MHVRLPIALLLAVAVASAGDSKDPASSPGDLAPAEVETAEARRGTLRRTIEREGTFLPADFAEIRLDFEAYKGELRLTDVLPHGSFVNEGDIVARLDTEAADEQIERARRALAQAEMDLRHAEAAAREAAEQAAEAHAKAQREAERTAKRLRGFLEHEKKFEEESERLNLQWRKHNLENQKDELDQLEKMYAEDELVDATEEIVLKRQRRGYARSVASFELSERRRLYQEEWYEPEKEEDIRMRAEHAAAALQRLEAAQARAKEKTEVQLEQKRFDLAKQREAFAELEKDREGFTVRAPRRGILLHGEADGAPWPNEHEAGATVRNRTVLVTVADPKRYGVRTSVEEKDLLQVKSGTAAEVAPTIDEERTLMGRLRLDYLPGKGGVFEAEVLLGEPDVRLRPGLSGTVRIIVEEVRDAVLVPLAAVHEKDGAKVVRCAKTAAGPFEERVVTTGIDDGTDVVIRDGVEPGEHVVVGEGAGGS